MPKSWRLHFCGPKLSLCCAGLGVWGIIQLSVMAVCYSYHSFGLVEDIADNVDAPASVEDIPKFYKEVDAAYENAAFNCWVAVGIYCFVLLLSVQQFIANHCQPF